LSARAEDDGSKRYGETKGAPTGRHLADFTGISIAAQNAVAVTMPWRAPK
jgi:hypothetical protein